MDDQRGNGDLRDATVGLPAENALELTHIPLRGRIPLHTDGHVFVDALARRSGVINERDDGFLGFFGSDIAAQKSLQRFRFGLYGMGTAGGGATQNQRAPSLSFMTPLRRASASTKTWPSV